jgi:hypothetical protein
VPLRRVSGMLWDVTALDGGGGMEGWRGSVYPVTRTDPTTIVKLVCVRLREGQKIAVGIAA